MAAGSVASAAMAKPPMSAQQAIAPVSFDNSGWNVNFGAGATQSATSDRSAPALGAPQLLRNPLVLLAILAGLYYLSTRK